MNWTRNLVLLMNNYWKQQTDNNKTLILFFYWLKTDTCSKFCINISHLNESETLKSVMSELFFCEGFSLGHVIITTIIISTEEFVYRTVTKGLKRQWGKYRQCKFAHGTCRRKTIIIALELCSHRHLDLRCTVGSEIIGPPWISPIGSYTAQKI